MCDHDFIERTEGGLIECRRCGLWAFPRWWLWNEWRLLKRWDKAGRIGPCKGGGAT